jgi:hypothetical protein
LQSRTPAWQGIVPNEIAPKGLLADDFAPVPATQTITGRKVGGIQNQIPLSDKATVKWLAKGGAADQGQGLLADQGEPAGTVTPAPDPAKPWAEFGDNDQAKSKYYKIKNIGQFLRSQEYLNWENRPADLKSASPDEVKGLFGKALEYGNAKKLPNLPKTKFTNPDPASDTYQRILKEAGLI